MEPRARISPLQKVAATWHVVAVLAVMLAKLMRRFEDGHLHGARAQAEQLDVIVRAAHVMLMQDIAEAEEHEPAQPEARHTRAHLRCIAASLLVVSLVLRRALMRGLFGVYEWMQARGAFYAATEVRFATAPGRAAELLDPG